MTGDKTERNPRGAGRKLKPPDQKYKSHNIKFLPGEWEKIKELALSAGLSASEYVRKKALER
ncbi:hypothetical protein Psfp_02363 [Pelotomaculum sp. FP]|uniref:plasmid mobilization protein n=1 Tax=Pelotomaculum sp. FP TaxID=261474 RepID=UPI001066472B|nr:hypothetical protein [Pelotomaculum sp. FP]TEB15187.1 hypothetical protein Psfp_02363 [Pelotomaculum sp. FP]